MIIKDINRFLIAATIVSVSMVGVDHSAASSLESAGKASDSQSISFRPASRMRLNGLTPEGNASTLYSMNDAPDGIVRKMQDVMGSVNMTFHDGKANGCFVLIKDQGVFPGLDAVEVSMGPALHQLGTVDRSIWDFFVVSHELAHCFNDKDANSSMSKMQNELSTDEYSGYHQIGQHFITSINEVYADLHAVILGASKTGDWSVFSKGVLHVRSMGIDLDHTSLNAVSHIISDIEPDSLKGLSFAESNALANNLFKTYFLEDDMEVSLHSRCSLCLA